MPHKSLWLLGVINKLLGVINKCQEFPTYLLGKLLDSNSAIRRKIAFQYHKLETLLRGGLIARAGASQAACFSPWWTFTILETLFRGLHTIVKKTNLVQESVSDTSMGFSLDTKFIYMSCLVPETLWLLSLCS